MLEIRRAVKSLATDASTHFAVGQRFSFVLALRELHRVAGAEAVPLDVFRHDFFRLLDLASPLLLGALLLVREWFPALFESEFVSNSRLLRKLLGCANDQYLGLEQRLLALQLLIEYASL